MVNKINSDIDRGYRVSKRLFITYTNTMPFSTFQRTAAVALIASISIIALLYYCLVASSGSTDASHFATTQSANVKNPELLLYPLSSSLVTSGLLSSLPSLRVVVVASGIVIACVVVVSVLLVFSYYSKGVKPIEQSENGSVQSLVANNDQARPAATTSPTLVLSIVLGVSIAFGFIAVLFSVLYSMYGPRPSEPVPVAKQDPTTTVVKHGHQPKHLKPVHSEQTFSFHSKNVRLFEQISKALAELASREEFRWDRLDPQFTSCYSDCPSSFSDLTRTVTLPAVPSTKQDQSILIIAYILKVLQDKGIAISADMPCAIAAETFNDRNQFQYVFLADYRTAKFTYDAQRVVAVYTANVFIKMLTECQVLNVVKGGDEKGQADGGKEGQADGDKEGQADGDKEGEADGDDDDV
jgi:hypothetical protein